MSVYADLDRQWDHIGATPAASSCLTGWSTTEPPLRGYATPAALVADIVNARRSPRGRHLLAALLRVAADPFAARTTLQAILPALRAEPVLEPSYGHRVAERWSTPQDTFADLVCAAWDTIRAHAGENHADPELLVVRAATRRLRTARQAHVRRQRRSVAFNPDRHEHPVGMHQSARTSAEQVAAALLDAVQRETLSLEQAQLLYATSVAGLPAIGAAVLVGLPKPRAVYHALAKAEAALAASPA